MKRGDVVCYKGNRSALATVTMVSRFGTVNMGGLKASLIWLTGPKMGTKREHDIRDLIIVEEAG